MTPPLPHSGPPVPSPDRDELAWPERLARLAVWALVTAVLARNLGPLKEGDEWMHLSIGRWMLQHGTLLPSPDPLMWQDKGGDLQHEWLSQVVLAAVHQVAGFGGLRLLRGVLMATAAGLVAFLTLRSSQRWSTALGAASLWWMVSQPHAAARPHLLGWLFALLTLGVLLTDSARWTWRRWLAYSVLLVVWAQAHSSQIVAPAFIGLHTLSLTWHNWRDGRPVLERDWLVRTALAGIAVFLQPCGWELLPYAWRSPRVAEGLVEEWAPTFAADIWQVQPWIPVLLGLVLLAVPVAALWQKRPENPPFPTLLPSLLASIESLHTRRMTFFAWLPLLFVTSRIRVALKPAQQTILALVLAGGAWWTTGRVAEVWPQRDWVQGNFPMAATQFLDGAKLQGRLFNPDPWGGWLAWWLHGETMPCTDGRMLMAGRQWALDSLGIQAHAPQAEQLLAENNVSIVLQRRSDWLRTRPLDPQQFVLAWQDDTAVVVLRRDDHFAENLRRTCAFYGKFPALQGFGHWPQRLVAPPGQASPTDVPAALGLCVEKPAMQ